MEWMEFLNRMGRGPQVILDQGEVSAETPADVSRHSGDSSAYFLYGKAT
jgi:hypothetical protein